MAKCINTVIDWADRNLSHLEIKPVPEELLSPTCKEVLTTERILNKKLDHVSESILAIGTDLMTILNSCNSIDDRWDCGQVQSTMLTKLDALHKLIKSYIGEVSSLDVISCNKHRYFNYLNTGVMVRLRNMANIVGRYSDQDATIFYDDFLNPMTSDQSIFLHSLGSIWSFIINSMKLFELPARTIVYKEQFESEDDEYIFLEEMDFICGARKHARIFLMDLICTSWIKFNHLVKLNDLINTHPLPCLCSSKRYFATLKIASNKGKDNCSLNDDDVLQEMLDLVLNPDGKQSMQTANLRDLEILPLEPPFKTSDLYTRSYFVLWHLYSLSNFMQKQEQKLHLARDHKSQLVACMPLMELCLTQVTGYFRDAIVGGNDIAEPRPTKALEATSANNEPMTRYKDGHSEVQIAATKKFERFSPHQEERFALIFHMIDHFTESMATESLPLVAILLQLFVSYWPHLGTNYFQSNQFRVKSMTLFQLFTKIITDSTEIEQRRRACDPKADQPPQTISSSCNERKLELIWDQILAQIEETPTAAHEAISKIASPANCADNIASEKA